MIILRIFRGGNNIIEGEFGVSGSSNSVVINGDLTVLGKLNGIETMVLWVLGLSGAMGVSGLSGAMGVSGVMLLWFYR